MTLLQGLLAGAVGTVFMNLSSETEMHYRGRQASTTPGYAANTLLRLIGVPRLEGRSLNILSSWAHYLYGTAWGVVLWLYLDILSLGLAVGGVAFWLTVWGFAQIQMPILAKVPPFWKWGAKELAIDLFHHLVYAVGAVLSYQLVEWAILGLPGT